MVLNHDPIKGWTKAYSLNQQSAIQVGVLLAHYYTERTGFYGININTVLPFNFLRDVHTQTPIIWIEVMKFKLFFVKNTGNLQRS